MRWLVADRHGLHALVEALDFATLVRVHEQSVTGDGEALRVRSYVDRFILAISVALGQVGGIDWSTGLTGNCHANRRFI